MYHALIMAGGTGTRLWPLSRRSRPKQAIPLVGERTMFAAAVERIAPLFPTERIAVVTRQEHVDILAAQAPELPAANFLVEPEGRGTAPAIGLAAIHLHHHDPEAIMAVLTADQHIADTARFCLPLAAAAEAAQQGKLVTLGIHPSSPATGYGYIQQGDPLGALGSIGDFPLYRVDRFIEKPDLETATYMVASGDYSWNSGMFIWRVDRILEEFQRYMPQLYAQLAELEAVIDSPDYQPALERIWPQVAKETIDYGVMEKADDITVIPVDIGWSDVGSWASLPELLAADESGNTVIGPHLGVDTRNSLIYGSRSRDGNDKRLIATIGVEDLVIVDTEDALLICPRDREQEVRRVVQLLEEQGDDQWL